jgi:hypothetical protein
MIVHAVREGERYYISEGDLPIRGNNITLKVEIIETPKIDFKQTLPLLAPDGQPYPPWLERIHTVTRRMGDLNEEEIQKDYYEQRLRDEGLI